jgi:deoxyguanosine kinase
MLFFALYILFFNIYYFDRVLADLVNMISASIQFLVKKISGWFSDCIELQNDPLPFRVISLEGNIGSGKTTLLKTLEKTKADYLVEHGVVILLEPVEKWEALKDPMDGESILAKFYKEPKRYAFLLQMYILETTIEAIEKTILDNPQMKILLLERSILSTLGVFGKLLLNSDYMTPLEYKQFEKMVMEHAEYFPDDVIYLDVPPDVCIGRIEQRDRKGESKISLDYLQKWEECCKTWLFDYRGNIIAPGMGHEFEAGLETILNIPYDENTEFAESLICKIIENQFHFDENEG